LLRSRTIGTWLRPEEVLGVLRNSDTVSILEPLSPNQLSALKEASQQFPEVRLYIKNAFGGNLEELAGFEHLRSLAIDEIDAKSFEVLTGFTELRKLEIYPTRSVVPSIASIANCRKLKKLKIQGHGKGLETIASLKGLVELRLLNLKTKSLEPLTDHPTIERLEILYASTRILAPLATMDRLRRLLLSHIRGLEAMDLEPLSSNRLDMFSLSDEPHVEDLDSLGCANIGHLSLDNLRSLRTLRSLRFWPQLTTLGLRGAHPDDGSLVEVATNPSLRHLAIAMVLPREELRQIQIGFEGVSLSYRGEYLWGVDEPSDIIASRIDL
jgi:hypothetical protein